MLKKILSIIFVVIIFSVTAVFLIPHDKIFKVTDLISPTKIVLNNGIFELEGLDCFDSAFTAHNEELSKVLGISSEEAFLLGNLGKYRFENMLKGHSVYIKENDLIFYRYSYRTKFLNSGFCIKDLEPCSKLEFEYQLKNIKKKNYKVFDLDNEIFYDLNDKNVQNLSNFIVMPYNDKIKQHKQILPKPPSYIIKDNIKFYLTDLTTKLKPDRKCSSDICKEILSNINNSQKTIDIAIYGYSHIPEIEKALADAKTRGVDIRLVYDEDSKGNNIYEHTSYITKLIPQNISDGKSSEANSIMHNKFYIFDDKVLITGSANLSHTDMSGFNSNSVIVVESEEIANVYKQEFEQMYSGKFHNDKTSCEKSNNGIMEIYFSPQDKSITNSVLPLVRKAKKYIYIPTFVLTDEQVTEELIKAKKRGVDVKIIIDAVNASSKYSKHKLLRDNGILVKTENYAGKMHSKSMLIDDEYTLIGSMNFSYSGENKNDENLIVLKDSDITKFYKQFFLYQWSKIDDRWLKYNVRAEGKFSIGSCEDGIDNNFDGLADKDDPACLEK